MCGLWGNASSASTMIHAAMLPPPTQFLQPNSGQRFCSFLASSSRILSHGGRRISRLQAFRQSMFLNAKPVLKDGTLRINGKDALTGVPDNVVVTPLRDSSAFVGATCTDASSRLVFKLGVIEYACYYFLPTLYKPFNISVKAMLHNLV